MSARNLLRSIASKANINSPILTGDPTVPSKPVTSDSLAAANVTMLRLAIANLVASAPGTLDTLDELAAALGDDANFAATIATSLSNKQPLDATLTALAGLTTSANKLIQSTGADAFTLLDLALGNYTPEVTLSNPGTLSVTYGSGVLRKGYYRKIGDVVDVMTTLAFTPTYGTGTGDFRFGLPFAARADSIGSGVVSSLAGISFGAGVTQVDMSITEGTQFALLRGLGSGVQANLGIGNLPSGSQGIIVFNCTYRTA